MKLTKAEVAELIEHRVAVKLREILDPLVESGEIILSNTQTTFRHGPQIGLAGVPTHDTPYGRLIGTVAWKLNGGKLSHHIPFIGIGNGIVSIGIGHGIVSKRLGFSTRDDTYRLELGFENALFFDTGNLMVRIGRALAIHYGLN